MQDTPQDEEDHIRNLSGAEALDKLKEIAEGARICMFTTYTDTPPMPSRPMALQEVDDDGTLHFFSSASSEKNHQVNDTPFVQLMFANNSSSEYLNIYGKATISQDRAKIKELWNAWAKGWFQEGPDDPDLTLISVKPIKTEYWDTKVSKVVTLLKVAASLVTGKVNDDGVEGELKV